MHRMSWMFSFYKYFIRQQYDIQYAKPITGPNSFNFELCHVFFSLVSISINKVSSIIKTKLSQETSTTTNVCYLDLENSLFKGCISPYLHYISYITFPASPYFYIAMLTLNRFNSR